ncbi:hypothetical protein QWY85_14850 [Neolewinella lacunae]|uniref:Uncharacterized protein n=1 Tax=Neolewinella lacunae TaxID=1517758 RepID=A0A923TDH3_9BACT|nr:hypothetical protein [Neolewinella lacunae]MBC6994842.1 hypothetical protein [Neolewinella lacunae]MDN3635945.1 hypothetical protein [Neolewinella lacunae]
MNIYNHKSNTDNQKKFLIPKSAEIGNQNWVEISIDNERQKFVAQRLKIEQPNNTEWEVYNDATFPSSLLNEFLRSETDRQIKWDYISGWEDKGEITPELLVKWAYVENGYFSEQDEDLMMRKPELIKTMHDLMIDEYSNRKIDLSKILKSYAKEVYQKRKDKKAISEFEKILNFRIDNSLHEDFKNYLKELKK